MRLHRRAVTLIEILVVIAIIAILIAFLVPAVQRMRAAAQRAECGNNLKQIGLAVHQYHDHNGRLPAGMIGKDPYRFASWLTYLLPYVEQQNLGRVTQAAYQKSPSPFNSPPHVGLATVIPTFVCPADDRAGQPQIAQKNNYLVAFTSYLGVSGKDLTTKDCVFFRDSYLRIADITDGTSSTLMAGERPPSADFQFGWWYAGAGQKFTGSCDMLMGVYEQNALPVMAGSCAPGSYPFGPGNARNQCDMFHFWSEHSGGAHFLFADGSVHFVSYSVGPALLALASRAGNEAVNLPLD